MKQIVAGILAHVDAGKTTLSEALLYRSGEIRHLGRVDHGDAFLDTNAIERQRGITIFSKQAHLVHGDLAITLLDTPGHVDFSAETERVLSVLDYAILVVSGVDGIQGHTETLWRLLARYDVPTFIFVNKMDSVGADRAAILTQLKNRFSDGCVDCSSGTLPTQQEEMALQDEAAMDEFLEMGELKATTVRSLIASRKMSPCYFGSALKVEGIDEFLDGLEEYTRQANGDPAAPFGALVYKISHDAQGNRLTWMKVTSGRLVVKAPLEGEAGGEPWQEKTDQIRLYSGEKFELAEEVSAGGVCAVTGLSQTVVGEGIGVARDAAAPVLEPVLTYTLQAEGADVHKALASLRVLEDEDPLLHVRWLERLQEVHLQLMGEVQLEIIQQMMHERFGLDVSFGPGSILYRETITAPVEGVGHFEPLRHYAEMHVLMEPLPQGSGLEFASTMSLDDLDRNWQRLILTHLREREHLGTLIGAPITDMRLTLVAARAHLKHTEGGDFRQATYRGVRQGLMKARARGTCRILEPWYRFRLEVPAEMIGRAMSDIQRMSGSFEAPVTSGEFAVIEGAAPVSEMRDYTVEVNAYTHGRGHITCIFDGYHFCHNEDEVIAASGYDPEVDLENTPDSVFCAHGAGYPVKWNRVEDFMHVSTELGI
ncbi:MAG: TetM/TetW/TetO/TetS family tetracycline resistance ribosomal protection protein [Bifidobacteriaceae bacterium]|jgi:small GTP-binding protein|nr:TetM/TetW/TetO/TetS family tetracycline resistance ribosomal protection protein [Bifidobacteriaceae bacterium]MCI1914742.1 TetM/TetW/TetO/TetS family tetracycline resistance ribosomal protection protein [Bifidobacteriaceae bacterium]